MKSHRGFTLVEVLTTVAIVGLLVALLLPAVQRAREAARRTQCANNLRQIAMALQAYAQNGQAFPYGFLDEMSTTVRKRDTWMQQTWPFLEQMPLFQQYMAGTNAWVMDTPPAIKDVVIPTFMCASDPKAPGFGGGGNWSPGYGFQGNYVGCATDGYIEVSRTEAGYPLIKLNGIFYGNSRTPLAAIRDGLSNTLLLSEVKIRGVGGALPTSKTGFDAWWGDGGAYWGGGQHGSFGFSTMETPNNSTVSDRTYACKRADPGDPPCISVGDSFQKVIIARSHHGAGVNVALADSSIRFVSDDVSPIVWKGLATRAGGESVSLE